MPEDLAAIQADLVAWEVLEAGAPVRFTRRFQGALTRAAAALQQVEQSGERVPGNPVTNQVEAALAEFMKTKGKRAGPGHRRFATAVQIASLPEAVRQLLGL